MWSNKEIIKHMKEDMTFRGLSETTQKSYIWRVGRYMEFHKGKNIEELTEDDIRDYLKYLVEDCKNKRRDINTYNSAIRFIQSSCEIVKVSNITPFSFAYAKSSGIVIYLSFHPLLSQYI